jgi:hypothetical protein
MSFVSEIEVVHATNSTMWNHTINESDRVFRVVFFAELHKKTNLRVQSFSSN